MCSELPSLRGKKRLREVSQLDIGSATISRPRALIRRGGSRNLLWSQFSPCSVKSERTVEELKGMWRSGEDSFLRA